MSKNPVAPTLAETGIDKNLAHHARAAGRTNGEPIDAADTERVRLAIVSNIGAKPMTSRTASASPSTCMASASGLWSESPRR